MAVNSVNGFNAISPIVFDRNVPNTENKGLNFAEIFNNAINSVNDLQIQSKELTENLAVGRTDNIHEVLIAGEKAEVALQLTMQIRNKILDAYSEIMRMQI
ncbi:flagellar hook-basal body complex protein FliE [Pseudobacteroides cellulosolvens]|uniref:Flagellar hook-basal body complex protein FliE n=1 Tax=Pseudobacteroides cellulosolvens ATCC 35603 = DSM 2933 TaxID=398512 RepID=A0A0L6JRR7_9FIRM|nr:flagellar hook-basal body complex protein FliE [Pseudobacteroides cellulosolvens]KNY28385.1 Flagellar hook-basal body complex protein fliE [Pseudobacteroides cellulosolvens ATCC 35603 = DSM 2933]